jgi:hypothetical protein
MWVSPSRSADLLAEAVHTAAYIGWRSQFLKALGDDVYRALLLLDMPVED